MSDAPQNILTPMLIVGILAAPSATQAHLEPEHVLLLFNGRNAESVAIRNAYISHHPSVHEFDLDLDYPTTYPNSSGVVPPEQMDNHYITAARFTEVFVDDASPFQTYLAEHPEIVAITTTRGLPAVVSDNFSPPVNHSPPSASNVWGSFEGLLSRSGTAVFPWQEPGNMSSRTNPYSGSTVPFHERLANCGQPDGICPGELYLVSRLDSSVCAIDYDGNGARTHLDGVLALIDRSAAPIPVNTYAVTMLYDDNPPNGSPDDEQWCTHNVKIPPQFEIAQSSFLRDNWCQMEDQTSQFLHGPNHAVYDPATDGPYMNYPVLSLITMGRNHCGSADNTSELAAYDYIRSYEAHPAGFFNSIESYNGQCLHKFQASPGSHGQFLDWIGYAGGSFATGHVQGVNSTEFALTFLGMQNLYHNGFSWGEALYTFLQVGGYNAPVGDPLARVTLIRPDLNSDRIVDQTDRDFVSARLGTADPDADLDGNGIVDAQDLMEIDLAFGRSQPAIDVPDPSPGLSICGDVTRDSLVDISDILGLISQWGPCPLQGPCTADTNGDYEVDVTDLLLIINRWGWAAGDIDGNQLIDIDDLLLVLDLLGTTPASENWNRNADTDCNDIVDDNDMYYIVQIIYQSD